MALEHDCACPESSQWLMSNLVCRPHPEGVMCGVHVHDTRRELAERPDRLTADRAAAVEALRLALGVVA